MRIILIFYFTNTPLNLQILSEFVYSIASAMKAIECSIIKHFFMSKWIEKLNNKIEFNK